MAAMFRERDVDRLTRRIEAVTAGDLTPGQVKALIGGDLEVLKGLPRVSRQGVAALLAPRAAAAGELEKMVGSTEDFVPVAYLDLSRAAANAVARVVDAKRRAIGTGFMVSPRLFLTNNHVADTAEVAGGQVLQFGYELAVDGTPIEPTEFALDPASFFWTSSKDDLDATVVAVGEPVSGDRPLADFGWCPLSSAKDKHADGDFVTIIQHPEGDFKQIALRENRVIGRGKAGRTLHYGADTLKGSSGSPVFNDQFSVVALHHAGGPRNEATLDSDEPVPEDSNEGIRISALVKALRDHHDELPPPSRVVLAEALNPPTTGPVFEAAPRRRGDRALPAAPVVPAISSDGGAVVGSVVADLSLPIRLTLGGVGAAPGAPPPIGSGEVERNQPPDRDYENRRGYDPDFLTVSVLPPKIGKSLLKSCAVPTGATRSAASVLVPYHHFSVVLRADRKMPLFTIVNIDGRNARSINRETGEIEATETWYSDPRLSDNEQMAQPFFDRQRPRHFDRGHLVRRLDPAWGSPAAARTAADDTFHFTNCCPQISDFNQHLWQRIENYALNNATDENKRITVITGPVFAKTDPSYRGTAVPRGFWKIVVRVDNAKLKATAFLADQGEALDAALAEEGPEAFDDLGKVAIFQKTVTELEKLSRLDFGVLRDHDTVVPELEAFRPLGSLDEVSWSATKTAPA